MIDICAHHRRRGSRAALAAALVAALLGPLPPAYARVDRAGSAAYYEDALRYFEGADFDAAVVQLKNALQADPANLSARILLGRSLLEQKKPYSAEAELRTALGVGADASLILVPLATSYLMQRKYARLLEEVRPGQRDLALEVQVLALRAEAYLALHMFEDAEETYVSLQAIAPRNASAYLGRAMIALGRGRDDEAEDFVEQAIAAAPELGGTWFVKGEVRRFRQDPEGAIEHYDRAIELDPGHQEAYLRRAEQLLALGRTEDALVDIEHVRGIDKDDPEANFLYALALTRTGDVDGARRVIDDVALYFSSLDPDAVSAHGPSLLLSGYVNFRQGHLEEAYASLIRYIRLFPAHIGARKLAARILLRKDEPLAAIDVVLPALGLAPGDPSLYVLAGQAYLNSRQYARATGMFERAAELAPDNVSTRTALALSKLGSGRIGAGEADLAQALDMQGSIARPGLLLGHLHVKRGEYRQALEVARRVAESDPRNPAAWELAGLAHVGRRDLERATESFRKALEVDPTYAPATVQLGRIAVSIGRGEEGARLYRKALDLQPQNVNALAGLAVIAEREGRIEDALETLERVRAIDTAALEPLLRLAGLLITSRRPGEALKVLEDLERVAPDDAAVVVALARTHEALGDGKRARSELQRASRLAGGSPTKLTLVARYQRLFDDPAGARWSLDKAVQLAPRHLPAQAALIQLDLAEGQDGAAMERARMLRVEHPGSALVDVLLGDALSRLGREEDAARAYEAALVKEDRLEYAARLHGALRRGGREQEALATLEAWLGRNAESIEGKRVLAGAYIDAGRADRALVLMEEVRDRRPDDVTLLNNLAWLYHRERDARAIDTARRAYELAPEDADVLDTYGWILAEQGADPGAALPLLREAYSRRSRDPAIRYHLAATLARLGRVDEARRELRLLLDTGTAFDDADAARRLLDELG